MYKEYTKIIAIDIIHPDKSISKFSGTKAQIGKYLEYLWENEDISEFYVVDSKCTTSIW